MKEAMQNFSGMDNWSTEQSVDTQLSRLLGDGYAATLEPSRIGQFLDDLRAIDY